MRDLTGEKKVRVFEFNDELSGFRELDYDINLSLHDLLDSEAILLFIDKKRKRVWMWIGSNSTIKMKFRATQESFRIRDNYAFGYRISSVDEGNENKEYKIFIGLEEEEEDIKDSMGPQYRGTPEELEKLKDITEEEILLRLEKTPVPTGYKRRLVIVNNEVYLYKIYKREYISSKIEEKRLFRLKEEVEDGQYLLDGYTPRLLLSNNKILMIDLLQKIEASMA